MSEFDEAFEKLFRQLGLTPDPSGHFDLNSVLAQMQGLMGTVAGQGAKLSWPRIKEIARTGCHSQGPDPYVNQIEKEATESATTLADQWLDAVISFDRLHRPAASWSRAEWIEGTLPVWQSLISPVADSLTESALTLIDDDGLDPQMSAMMKPMFAPTISMMLATQIGRALGELPKHLLTACDLGLPLLSPPQVVLLPQAIATLGLGLDLSATDLRIYLALRETARQRLFASVTWLGPQVLALVSHYASGIKLDSDAINQHLSQQMSQLPQLLQDPSAMAKSSAELAGTLFTPAVSPEQIEIQERLETVLALIEGWVDDVVTQAASAWMPNADALLELIRRHRATVGGDSLTRLIGLELRPRRVRDAANLWAMLRSNEGIDIYRKLWSHPDFLPTADDLDDPLGYWERHGSKPADEMDAELAKLLGETE